MDKQGFINYLEGKGLAPLTQEQYLLALQLFFNRVKKEDLQVAKPDILKHLEYLKKRRGLQNITRNNHLIALNHYFTYLYKDGQTNTNPCLLLKIRGKRKKTLHKIYTPEELETLFDNYHLLFVRNYDDSRHRHEAQRHYSRLYRERNALIVSILFNQGTSTSEIEKIETGDVDLIKATLKIQGGKRGKDRVLPLKATQIGLFINYMQNIRPQLLEYQSRESDKLFLPLPAISYKKTENDMARGVFTPLSTQIKTIDKQFINFQQIRASVITFWIKTQGLRKAQYLAGHRCICTTEKYVANDLENLIDDINKLHPFL
ncbi:recombinase XerC [Bacteroidia bacterium]|nr:recombinase XerC [Bacteroidia bacterium]